MSLLKVLIFMCLSTVGLTSYLDQPEIPEIENPGDVGLFVCRWNNLLMTGKLPEHKEHGPCKMVSHLGCYPDDEEIKPPV